MKLRDLMKVPTLIDEDFHRWYSRKVEKWEDKGRNKYDLSLGLEAFASLTGVTSYVLEPSNLNLSTMK